MGLSPRIGLDGYIRHICGLKELKDINVVIECLGICFSRVNRKTIIFILTLNYFIHCVLVFTCYI